MACNGNRWAVLFAALLVAPAALANGIGPDKGALFVNMGLLVSATSHNEELAGGLGGELSVHGFVNDEVGVGLFGQYQTMGFKHHRFSGGLQGTVSFAGLELGATRETASEERAPTTSLHIAPFASIGFVTLSLRFGIPLSKGTSIQPRHGTDIGMALAFKLPLALSQR